MSENNQKMAPHLEAGEKNRGFCGPLTGVKAVEKGEEGHIVWLTFEENIKGKLIFLEETIFRYDVDPSGAFESYAAPREKEHTAKIQQCPDESDFYTKPEVEICEENQTIDLCCGKTKVSFDKATAKMKISVSGNR